MPAAPPRRTDYDGYREKQAAASRSRSEQGRDIGPVPAVANPKRRAKAKRSLRHFCECYFPDLFVLKWSQDHLTVLARMEACVRDGGRFALAMPRGSGKTTLCEAAALWASLYGLRRFVMIVAATKEKAEEILDRLKASLETNDLLAEDFPEVCHPVRKLERIYNRCNGQTVGGVPTRIGWTKRQVVLPTVPGSVAAGAIVRVAGITGAVRGAKHQTADGESLRPDLALVDDPQTESSAHSKTQNTRREQVLKRAVLGLAGPGKKIACLMACTVIAREDLADRFLDRKQNPDWQGERMRLLYEEPTDGKLWDEYARIRAESFEGGQAGDEAATAFYKKNRKAMDAGSRVAWPERYEPGELSALQHAINLRLRDPSGFMAEFQNDPVDERSGPPPVELTTADIAAKCLPQLPRATCPREATRVTAFVDVQKEVLFWLVVAWDEKWGGAVIDYGAFPDQTRTYFTAADPRPKLSEVYANLPDLTARLHAGLTAVAARVLGRAYPRQDAGDELSVSMCMIDANWADSRDVVYRFCRGSEYRARLLASHGFGVKPEARPMAEWKRTEGERVGSNWRLVPARGDNSGRHAKFDGNAWKSFLSRRIKTAPGGYGSLGVFGRPGDHRLLIDHLTAEYATALTAVAQNRTVEVWKAKPSRTENHWLDGLVGSAVAASITGLAWDAAAAGGVAVPRPAARKQYTMAELQALPAAERRRLMNPGA